MPFNPILPAEQPFTEAEIAFMEEEPPGVFPQNQDSVFGLVIRRVWTNRVQELIDQLTTIYTERFATTSEQFLDEWEKELSLPVAPTGLTDAQRRSVILSRLRGGAFTRAMRNSIIEQYIVATFGASTAFGVGGIPLTGAGVPMYAEAGDVSTLYRVVETVSSWSYEVRIKNTITPDDASLKRALSRVTPAPFTFTVNYVATP